jgi:ataxia telangiectasia mutated family protein
VLSELLTRAEREEKRSSLGSMVRAYQNLAEVFIFMANTKPKASARTGMRFPIPSSLTECPNLDLVHVPCGPPVPVRKDADPIGIVRYGSEYELAGGLNRPKILTCEALDGRTYRQLVKGNDDLRQDALMQQVFVVANSLLRGDKAAEARKLQLATYSVIPLSPRTGLIEWVSGTAALGEILNGREVNDGLHHRYRPGDLAVAEAKRRVDAASKSGKQVAEYRRVATMLQPVFRHFFFESFPSVHQWAEAHTRYARSTAVGAMVGHVVGLGDRHPYNLLVHKRTGTLIHIDLGVAFEQGRTLRIPETVPFRLTRDLVDGLGPTGVEGQFRTAAEVTLTTLRRHLLVLLAVVEALAHDPLHRWTLSPIKAEAMGGGGAGGSAAAVDANRVIGRVRAKLHGLEYGEPLSVPAQVTRLIGEATNPDNLAMLFCGWQAFL